MKTRMIPSVLFAIFALVLAALPAGAQAPPSSVNLNAYRCPADYNQVSDCTKLEGVVVQVNQDGQPLDEITTSASEGATLEVMFGAAIELEILSGQPAGTELEPATLSFDAAEGINAVTLIFVDQEAQNPPPPHSDTNALVVQALVCPVAYAGNNYVRDCPGESGIEATVTRDADGFSVTQTTGADGIVGFQGLGEGTYTVELGVPGDFADFQTVCGTPDGFEPREVTNPNTNRIGVYLGPTEELTCTFFVIPVDAQGETDPTPTPTKPTTGDSVKALPSTGAGVTDSESVSTLYFVIAAGLVLVLAGAVHVGRQRA